MVRTKNSDPANVGVIFKVFRILETVHGSSSGLSLKAVCDATGIHKSTVHRLLKVLEGEGYLIRTQLATYMIGPKLSQMSVQTAPWSTLQIIGRPPLWELWRMTGETVNLATLDHGTVLYLEVLESPHEFRLASRVGTRRPLQVTGLGKALTAFQAMKQREDLIDEMVFVQATPNTIINQSEFREEMERVRNRGYAVDDEEAVLGARCLSAPILDSNGNVLAAVSVSGPVSRIRVDSIPTLAQALIKTTQDISAALGYSRTPRKSAAIAEITHAMAK